MEIGKIEEIESYFKVSLFDNTHAIVYYFEIKLELYYINTTNKYKYGIDSINSFNCKYCEVFFFFYIYNEKKFIYFYKSNVDNYFYILL